ncbi:hypothetical protein DMC30DRAFT_415486 [Rhodotorula diobovata]|uniref:Uncharacterized protein n=1 Tax=Rhodotorula diobovata TaxID=5288 RepID=A0A5C5G0S6_9BASI|nr:hypothetical protein DMC30DRAFT_415486 [Rhodotorula diobovata]
MTSTARAPALARADLPHRPTTPTSASSTTAALDALRPSPRTASVDRKRVRPEPPAVTPARRPSSPSPAPAPPPEPVRPTSPAPPKARREDWILPQIPPFRGGTTGARSAASASCAADAPPPPAAGPSAVPTSVAQADQAPRRVSYPLVFSLPRQNQRPATGPGRSESFSASTVTTGLGIAGVGVGAAGAREALVIERVGEASAVCARGAAGGGGGGGGRGGGGEAGASAEGGVRRGSLKRVLISDGEDELAAVRRRAAPASADESDLLSSTPAPAPTPSTSTCAAPFTGVPLSTLVLGEPIQDQYQRELDRRRESAPAPLAGASTSRRASVAGLQQDITSTSGSSLGKRRGHRPPAVTTGPSVPTAPATHRASFSAVQGESASLAALRSAPVDIPSVLVGSPMEATFAARARERERERASSSSAARETAPAPRRQGQGAAVHPQPPLVSSSSYYIRPNQPLGPGHSFPPPPPPPQQSSTGATSPRSGGPPQEHARTQAFLSLFSTFYDSLSDSRVLTASLDAQLGRAAQLLTTLQHAEAALDSALADVRREGERRWAAVEHRLARLEGGTAAVGDGEARARDGGLEARLARLERLLRDREEREDDTPRRPSGDSTSSGAVADSEASGAARDEDMEG